MLQRHLWMAPYIINIVEIVALHSTGAMPAGGHHTKYNTHCSSQRIFAKFDSALLTYGK